MATTRPDAARPDPAELLEIACAVVRPAARQVQRMRDQARGGVTTKTTETDVVTAADRAVERQIVAELRQRRPRDAVLGEEYGQGPPGDGVVRWVLDPIDGTVNYLYGIPAYAVSVAAVVGPPRPTEWTVVAGCVHSVADGRTWTATLGGGAYEDGRRVRVNPPAPLAESLLATGFGYTTERRRAQARVLVDVLPRVRDIRRIGSAAIDLCLVASGEVDLFYERGLQAWDQAAGTLVAAEAGATVVGLRGAPPSEAMTVAGPEPTVRELVALLEELRADTDDVAAGGAEGHPSG